MSSVIAQVLSKAADGLTSALAAGGRAELDMEMRRNLEAWEIIVADCAQALVPTEIQKDFIRLGEFVRAVNVEYLASTPASEPAGISALIRINRSLAAGVERREHGDSRDRADSLARYRKVFDHVKAMNLKSASDSLVTIAERHGEDSGLYYAIGLIQMCSGDVDGAVQSFEAAVALDQYAAEARNALIRIYQMRGAAEQAAQHLGMLKTLIGLVPNWQDAADMCALGAQAMQDGRYAEAFALAERASRLAPWITDAWWLMSFLSTQEKEFARAVDFAAEAMVRNGADARLRYHLVSCLYGDNQAELALAFHRQGGSMFSGHPDKELRRFFTV